MFAKTIITSDAFLDMPATTRCLYFLLGMVADDDGFVNAPRSVMRQAGATLDDMNLLIAKRFVLTFESGVVVIKHWKIHNLIQKDRYKETKYLEEKAQLMLDQNNAYTEADRAVYPPCIQSVSNMEPQVRLGKDSVGKENSIEPPAAAPTPPDPPPKKQFVKPTLDEVRAYCIERGKGVDADKWYNHYSANGWKVGRNPMKDWKAAVRTWEPKEGAESNARTGGAAGTHQRIGHVV